ncbi:hypothetical protein O181_001799 [Austropuccinia psidii MF-1]|uniref:Reverse transcriptase Ty1/copia-type domain-containing protein n=1 Tax=Austropuccinia psidii MF-1 TaxID=1389203 RepID=A0A9Q3GC87_9BASI|nr:hypothetical protein [Austropuccinia psidii MF-1]
MFVVKITHLPNAITLSHCHYVDSLLEHYGMTSRKPVATPSMPKSHMEKASTTKRKAILKLGVNYYSAVKSLSYASMATRPDLSFTVSALSHFLDTPASHRHTHSISVTNVCTTLPTVVLIACNRSDNHSPAR